jgi:hypothetical protein
MMEETTRRAWSGAMLQPTGAPAVKVNRVRPALVFPQEEAGRLLKAAKAQDVRAGGVFSAGPAGVQVWSEPWDDEGGTMGTSVHLGSVDWTYNTPTQFYITIYRCMATQEGLVGLPIEGVRANLHDAPVVDPFRATR